MSKLSDFCKAYSDTILNGTLLAIDPSSGSSSSMPGYALFQCGILIDSGHLEITTKGRPLHQRLYQLAQILQKDFVEVEQLDLVAVEYIPMKQFAPGKSGSGASVSSILALQRAVGVVQGSFGNIPMIEVAPVSWHKYADNSEEYYVKTDETDAIFIGRAVVETAKLEHSSSGTTFQKRQPKNKSKWKWGKKKC